MGLADVPESVVPKVRILAPPRHGGMVYSCYLTPHHVHAAHAVTGAICVACCASIQGTVASRATQPTETLITGPAAGVVATARIEHASGAIDIRLQLSGDSLALKVRHIGIVLTARKIMDGLVFVPANLCPSSGEEER